MSNTISLSPDKPEAGVPITFRIQVPKKGLDKLSIRMTNGPTFEVPLTPNGDSEFIGQIALYQEGLYLASFGETAHSFKVYPKINVGFVIEMGILLFSVFMLLGGLIVWTRKKRQKAIFS